MLLEPSFKTTGTSRLRTEENLRKQSWTVSGDVKTAAGRVSGSGRRLLQGRRWCAAAVSSSRLQRPAHRSARSAHRSAQHRSAPPLGTAPYRAAQCAVQLRALADVPKSAAAHALHAIPLTVHSAHGLIFEPFQLLEYQWREGGFDTLGKLPSPQVGRDQLPLSHKPTASAREPPSVYD